MTRWHHSLPRPIAFALSGGASLGAIQVGMMRSLLMADIRPDIVVGTSIGALNSSILAEHGLDKAVDILEGIWHDIKREHVFPGGFFSRVKQLFTTRMGAASIVVLDVGGSCHRHRTPTNVVDIVATALHAALRQRVLVEVPALAKRIPLLYLPAHCPLTHAPLNFNHTAELITQAKELTTTFLKHAPIPVPGVMSGAPHFHENDPIWTGEREPIIKASTT